jgi:hypothetical protein
VVESNLRSLVNSNGMLAMDIKRPPIITFFPYEKNDEGEVNVATE